MFIILNIILFALIKNVQSDAPDMPTVFQTHIILEHDKVRGTTAAGNTICGDSGTCPPGTIPKFYIEGPPEIEGWSETLFDVAATQVEKAETGAPGSPDDYSGSYGINWHQHGETNAEYAKHFLSGDKHFDASFKTWTDQAANLEKDDMATYDNTGTPSADANYRFFAQIIWGKTTHIGCAYHEGWLVCIYDPAGRKLYEVIYDTTSSFPTQQPARRRRRMLKNKLKGAKKTAAKPMA